MVLGAVVAVAPLAGKLCSVIQGTNRSRHAPAQRLGRRPSLRPASSSRKVKDKRQLTCAGAGKGRVAEPGRARQGRGDPSPEADFLTALGPVGGSAGPVQAHGLSVISSASAGTQDPAPYPPDPPWPAGALSARAVRAERAAPEEAQAAGSLPRTRGRRPRPRSHPHPPRAPGAQAGGGRGRGAATVAAAGPQSLGPRATPHLGPDPPALLPRPRPGPGLHQPDAVVAAAAVAGGLARSPPLSRTEHPARRGGAQRSPRNPFVWLKRSDVTRRPNRRLAGGGATDPEFHGAPCRTLGAGRGK
nr:translation initiation factor IF-2-like [Gorilla gorilla gorilla]